MATENQIEFLDTHKPKLQAGQYKLTIQSKLTTIGSEWDGTNGEYLRTPHTFQDNVQYFVVAGERYTLNPTTIHHVFPPKGNEGDYSDVFPQVILNRSTLPWERTAQAGSSLPWLALLLFDADEQPEVKVVRWKKEGNYLPIEPPEDDILMPYDFTDEVSDLKPDKGSEPLVQVIEVTKATLKKILPPAEDLPWLVHARHTDDGEERATVISNRLPKLDMANNSTSYAHLVSIEGLYPRIFDSILNNDTIADQAKIRLISLKSWSFSCRSRENSFLGILNRLDTGPFRLAAEGDAAIQSRLAEGKVLLPHQLRNGEKLVAWYRSPLVQQLSETPSFTLPVRASDSLLLKDPHFDIFDVSYAAAWELGQQLILANPGITASFYKWKRKHTQKAMKIEQDKKALQGAPITDEIRQAEADLRNTELPPELAEWFYKLSILQDIPFNYLVPKEALLPNESIRFFKLDDTWIDCLLDGAFSIGSTTVYDHDLDRQIRRKGIVSLTTEDKKISGFLLRSSLLAGWPQLNIRGNDAQGNKVRRVKAKKLADNVLFCLFEGEEMVSSVTIEPEVGGLNLGFTLDTDASDNFAALYKVLKNDDGRPGSQRVTLGEVQADENHRVIRMATLAEAVKTQLGNPATFTSAQFAFHMINGADKIQFNVTN
ncbi:MAG TPA: hypothetical protein DCS93_12800 [Microscillaceae bacterium]|nr:hypothetical protein [Microscillaceae bacterium]